MAHSAYEEDVSDALTPGRCVRQTGRPAATTSAATLTVSSLLIRRGRHHLALAVYAATMAPDLYSS